VSDKKVEGALTTRQVNKAVKAAGYPNFRRCVAELTTLGCTLTDIAKKLDLNSKRFWAYYQRWCCKHARPLRLGENDD
jgi:hypothetical protein